MSAKIVIRELFKKKPIEFADIGNPNVWRHYKDEVLSDNIYIVDMVNAAGERDTIVTARTRYVWVKVREFFKLPYCKWFA